MYMLNKSGPSSHPCGTPQLMRRIHLATSRLGFHGRRCPRPCSCLRTLPKSTSFGHRYKNSASGLYDRCFRRMSFFVMLFRSKETVP